MQKITLGVVCLTRNTFDYTAANAIYADILDKLAAEKDIDLVAVEQPIMEVAEATACGKLFAEKQVDGIAVISGTFHLGHLLLEIKKIADKPLLLWALPELPYNGGKIRLNSVCGVNLNASNLIKSGINDFTYTVNDNIDDNWLKAIRIIKALKTAKVGLLGSHAHGFFNVDVDELSLYGKYGVTVEHYDLNALWEYPPKPDYVALYTQKMQATFVCQDVKPESIEKVPLLAAKIHTFVEDKGLTCLAFRCWPEFAAGFGIAPCAAMSLVQSNDILLACEGDIDCGITMIAHAAIGAKTPFMADLSQVNIAEDTALMWHCGVAPCNLADGICTPTLDGYHAGGKGVTAGFVMPSGVINMARLDSIKGKYRLFIQRGEALPMEKLLSGTYAKVRFDLPMQQLLDKVIYSGIAHHVSMVYGDFTKAFEIFARLTDTEII